MGTNYYARVNICESCERFDEIHLGKSSIGWRFIIQIQEEHYKDFYEFERFIEKLDVKIFDEYRKEVPAIELLKLIESKAELKDHKSPNAKKDGYVDLVEGEFS